MWWRAALIVPGLVSVACRRLVFPYTQQIANLYRTHESSTEVNSGIIMAWVLYRNITSHIDKLQHAYCCSNTTQHWITHWINKENYGFWKLSYLKMQPHNQKPGNTVYLSVHNVINATNPFKQPKHTLEVALQNLNNLPTTIDLPNPNH